MRDTWIVIVNGAEAFDVEFQQGLLASSREMRGVHVRLVDEAAAVRSLRDSLLARTGRTGVVCHMSDSLVLKTVFEYDIPCALIGDELVDVWRRTRGRRVVVCKNDDRKIGTLAAEYLMGNGIYRSFVYVSAHTEDARKCWVSERYETFCETLEKFDYEGRVPHFSVFAHSPEYEARIFYEQIRFLPRPIAVFAGSDRVAREVISFCEVCGLHVPDDVAVLGVDDEESFCEQASTSISSIRMDREGLGAQALWALSDLLRGRRREEQALQCPPLMVVERASTRRDSQEDRFVSKAIEYIKNNARKNLGAEEIARASGISRSYLESRFKQIMGRTLHAYVREQVMALVKQALADTGRTVSSIADEFGFSGPAGLCSMFKRVYRISTSDYRRSLQAVHVG